MRGVQARRPSLFDLVDNMKQLTAPALIMTGDEDWPCLEPALLMKRTIPIGGARGDAERGSHDKSRRPFRIQPAFADFFTVSMRVLAAEGIYAPWFRQFWAIERSESAPQ